MINKVCIFFGYKFSIEKFTYPRTDGTFFNQTKRSIELFFNPFGVILSKQTKGVGKTITITKDVQDEFKLD